jgi:isochorismate synthase EntC
MLSTATALIEAVGDSIMEDEVINVARIITQQRNEMSEDDFAKAIYFYSGMLASATADKVTKVLLSKEDLQTLADTIDEMETMRNEVMNNGE